MNDEKVLLDDDELDQVAGGLTMSKAEMEAKLALMNERFLANKERIVKILEERRSAFEPIPIDPLMKAQIEARRTYK